MRIRGSERGRSSSPPHGPYFRVKAQLHGFFRICISRCRHLIYRVAYNIQDVKPRTYFRVDRYSGALSHGHSPPGLSGLIGPGFLQRIGTVRWSP